MTDEQIAAAMTAVQRIIDRHEVCISKAAPYSIDKQPMPWSPCYQCPDLADARAAMAALRA